MYRYNRCRYHKNSIIYKDISPLVGIVLSLFFRPIILFSFPEQSDMCIVQHSTGLASPSMIPYRTMIKSLIDSYLSEGLIGDAR